MTEYLMTNICADLDTIDSIDASEAAALIAAVARAFERASVLCCSDESRSIIQYLEEASEIADDWAIRLQDEYWTDAANGAEEYDEDAMEL